MRVFKRVEEGERVALLMAGIEQDNLIARRVVILLVAREEHVGAQIRKHLAYAVDEDVWVFVAIVGVDVLVDFLAHKTDEIVGVGFRCKLRCHHVGVRLVFLESVVEQRRVAKLLIAEILAERLEQVNNKCVYKVCRAFKLFLELLHLPTHLILLIGRVLIYIIVVEYVAAVLILELWRAQIFIQLWYSHALHNCNICL